MKGNVQTDRFGSVRLRVMMRLERLLPHVRLVFVVHLVWLGLLVVLVDSGRLHILTAIVGWLRRLYLGTAIRVDSKIIFPKTLFEKKGELEYITLWFVNAQT